MIKSGIFVYLPVMVFLLSSCGNIQEIEIREVKNFHFDGIENNNAKFTAELKIYNPNRQKFKVKEIDVRVLANDVYLGRMICDEEFIIPSKIESMISIPCGLRIANIFTGISTINNISKQDKVKVEVDGYILAQLNLVRKKVKINRTMMIDPPNK